MVNTQAIHFSNAKRAIPSPLYVRDPVWYRHVDMADRPPFGLQTGPKLGSPCPNGIELEQLPEAAWLTSYCKDETPHPIESGSETNKEQ